MAFLGLRLGNEPQLSPAAFQRLGALAEQLGYGEIWMTEGAGRDSLTQLASVALATQRIVVGTGILPVFSRTPFITAMSAAGMSEVSGGRFILGLGVGNAPAVENSHGVPFRRPLAHLEEAVTIIRSLLHGEAVTLQGKVFNLDGAALGWAAPVEPPPIYLAALGPRMLKMAGALADGVLLSWTASSYLKRAAELVREGAESAGRDPSEVAISGYVRMAVTDDPDAGRESLRQQMSHYTAVPSTGTSSETRASQMRCTAWRRPWELPWELLGPETALVPSAPAWSRNWESLAMPRSAGPGWKNSGPLDWKNRWLRPSHWAISRNPTASQWLRWLLDRPYPYWSEMPQACATSWYDRERSSKSWQMVTMDKSGVW